ncbi:bifunctional demethylmenaquinone methyltransferase/2-methoxy-6-polyprenyl-1,4-benzoquinol methylase UbiE [Hippea maritima]|uniref:Demethylmenaquinone methyltransferase n=1 Tax=Hippea maritima (strain ATCC 700847 / DSM 10411 / MH2) TaxID=760142 RepID=F2LTI9_HIPMA|nr:bifunctional demethylmenaquinone methyltransferase/2-methoxy-6-polyprenyl-1,4-benzoquinol methylase UbiE [Hippea maritima]AEA33314.1 Ubiquinone/menaquinone biosynthesis methyltransferase ubiE [Hippea maritima DSM 10411]
MLSAKNKEIASMFSSIAPTYDLLNHLLSFNIDKMWRKRAVSLLEGNLFLDVATGTGDVAIQITKDKKDSSVIGVDLSLEMLKVGKKKVKNRNIELVCAPAEYLPFKDNTFDGAIIAFGIRNVVDRVTALYEFKRVLKKGGRLVVLEFNTPVNKFFGRLYEFYSFTVMPLLGKIISGNVHAYTYLPNSIRRFPDVEFLKGMMERVGFVDVNYFALTFGVSFIHTGVKP